MQIDSYYSSSYEAARKLFIELASARSVTVKAYPIDGEGVSGEKLTIDTAWFGSERAEKIILVISGTHGAEFHCGAAIQSALLDRLSMTDNVAVLFVHTLNPWGASWGGRYTEGGVDLNRNYRDWEKEGPISADKVDFTREMKPFGGTLIPKSRKEINRIILSVGVSKLLHLLSFKRFTPRTYDQVLRLIGGHGNPDAMSYAGSTLTQNLSALKQIVKDYELGSKKQLVWVDIHSGLGKYAEDLLLSEDPFDSPKYLVGDNEVKPLDNGDVVYQKYIDGIIAEGIVREMRDAYPDLDVRFFIQEFGTYSNIKVLKALFFESVGRKQAKENPKSIAAQVAHAKSLAELRDMFYVDDSMWKRRVLERGVSFFEAVCNELQDVE